MARKKKNNEQESTIENYYDLKVDKVDELVAALKGETPEDAEPISTRISDCTSEDTPDTKTKKGKDKHFDPYKIDKLSAVPAWIKALFIKFWFAGCVCYFVIMGLGMSLDELDRVVLAGLVLGIVTDLLVNPIFRFLESDRKEYNNYMMFPFPLKRFWTFFTNIIYYIIIGIAVMYMYSGLNQFIILCGGDSDAIHVGVEPLLYGVFCVIIDMAFIGIKDLIVYLVKRGKKKRALANGEAEFDVDVQPAETHKEKRRRKGKNAETAETQSTEPVVFPEMNTTQDGDLTDSAQQAEGEEIDEIERLRRLAQSEDEDKSKTGKKK
ncbi:MAG: DUF1097 domain-containing protein [Candidatus Coproplasma sp.]